MRRVSHGTGPGLDHVPVTDRSAPTPPARPLRVFVAGASGVIGRALLPMLVAAGHDVAGTTRQTGRADAIRAAGARAVVVDVLDRTALLDAVVAHRPEVVIHQLTALRDVAPGEPIDAGTLERNARLRAEGTDNLVTAAVAAGARRLIAQSIAWVYAPGGVTLVESDPLLPLGPDASATLRGVHALETRVLGEPAVEGLVLRYGRLYGAGTWDAVPPAPPTVSVDAAARAAALAVAGGASGVYNIVDDPGPVSNAMARRELGWDPR